MIDVVAEVVTFNKMTPEKVSMWAKSKYKKVEVRV